MKLKLLAAVALLAGIVLIATYDPSSSGWVIKCPFKLLTGLDCPGCGGQRAAHALLNGDIVGAMKYNFFLVYAVPYVLLLIVERYLLRGEVGEKVRRVAEHKWTIWFYIVSFFVWFVVRNIVHI